MPTSLSDIKVKNSTSTLVIKPDDITINGVSIVGQNSFADKDLSNLSTAGQAVLDNKANNNLSNVASNIDYVVESKYPTAKNPSWYRVYKSGWVEQGGIISNSGGNAYITFAKAFKYTNYTFLVTPADHNGQNGSIYWSVSDRTTTSVHCMLVGNSNVPIGSTISWEARGMRA